MNQAPVHPEPLDRLLTEFYRARLPHSWPAAPVPPENRAEPAGPPKVRTTENPSVVPAHSDPSARARLTLAASVAILLGTCWYASTGGPIGERVGPRPATGVGPNVLPDATATMPPEFRKTNQQKAKNTTNPMAGFQPKAIPLP